MQFKGKVAEAEVVHEWLKAELWSPRFGKKVKTVLRQLKLSQDLILHPNFNQRRENLQRKKILKLYRHQELPLVSWEKVDLTPEDLGKIYYRVNQHDQALILKLYRHLRTHGFFPKIILLKDKNRQLKVLEGNLRLAAMLYQPEILPKTTPAFIGY